MPATLLVVTVAELLRTKMSPPPGVGEAADGRDQIVLIEPHAAHGRSVQRARRDDPAGLRDPAAREHQSVERR
jgi:hypothetical protein